MRILVIEDESELARIIQRVLERERFTVDIALSGDDGLEAALTGNFEAIILDRMLPGMDGLEICRRIREEGFDTPVLILSARGEMEERVAGLDSGADDYLGKPFAFEELLARIRALTRRSDRPVIPEILRSGAITLDQQARRTYVNDREIDLSPREFALLEYLMRNAGQVLSRDQILERVWGYDAEPEGNVVDLYIHYLRRKLTGPGDDSPIVTVRGLGYTMRT